MAAMMALMMIISATFAASASTPSSIGILAQGYFYKGLIRDAECLVWAIQSQNIVLNKQIGNSAINLSVFYAKGYVEVEETVAANKRYPATEIQEFQSAALFPFAVPEGTDLAEWLGGLDVLVSFEVPLVHTFRLAETAGVQRVILIMNADYTDHLSLKRVSSVTGFEVWGKGHASISALTEQSQGLYPVHHVPWSIPDPIAAIREPAANKEGEVVTFLMIAGQGGVRYRRGIDLALVAFNSATRKYPISSRFVISSTLWPVPVPQDLLFHENITILAAIHERGELRDLLDEADVVLYPSRWEGFGLSLLESLHAGVPALATDGWPINELVTHNKNGLLCRATNVGQAANQNVAAPHWEVSTEMLSHQIYQVSSNLTLRRQLTSSGRDLLVGRQYAFRLRALSRLLDISHPLVQIYYHEHRQGDVQYVAEAAENHGYRVDRKILSKKCEDVNWSNSGALILIVADDCIGHLSKLSTINDYSAVYFPSCGHLDEIKNYDADAVSNLQKIVWISCSYQEQAQLFGYGIPSVVSAITTKQTGMISTLLSLLHILRGEKKTKGSTVIERWILPTMTVLLSENLNEEAADLLAGSVVSSVEDPNLWVWTAIASIRNGDTFAAATAYNTAIRLQGGWKKVLRGKYAVDLSFDAIRRLKRRFGPRAANKLNQCVDKRSWECAALSAVLKFSDNLDIN